jgi:hypothetical protein
MQADAYAGFSRLHEPIVKVARSTRWRAGRTAGEVLRSTRLTKAPIAAEAVTDDAL